MRPEHDPMGQKPLAEDVILEAQAARQQGRHMAISLPGADLSGAHLPSVDLVGADLEGADLTGAVLAGAFLKRANLKNAILVGASLDGADLTEADLRGADLAGARIDDAILAGARLEGSCLQLVLGDPLSMSGSTLDRATIERSEFTMRDIAMMVVRGAYVDEQHEAAISLRPGDDGAPISFQDSKPSEGARPSDPSELPLVSTAEGLGIQLVEGSSLDPPAVPSSPPSGGDFPEILRFDEPLSSMPDILKALRTIPPSSRRRLPESVPTPSLTPPAGAASIIPSFRAAEISMRILHVEQDQTSMPVSQRMFQQLNALIDNARIEAAPLSLRPAGPEIRELTLDFDFPLPGEDYLGVTIDRELRRGTTSRCFAGTTEDGQKAVVRVFDPHCEGAALQLPAFQRGLRALNRLQALDEHDVSVVELIAVATDQTAYVAKMCSGLSLEEFVDTKMNLKTGLEAICSLARTVSAIHRHGVLVRSWKPSNVLVDGLTLLVGEPDMVHLSTLAQTRGDAGGYRAYAAPEELLGRGTRSPTADVYSLGKMLEFLLTGQEPLVPLGSPPLISQREGVPPILVEIVRRATAQEPTERYQHVDELLGDLVGFQQRGERAVLMASLRPAAISQLVVQPMSLSPPRPEREAVLRERLSRLRPEPTAPVVQPVSRARQLEVGAAIIGGICGVVLLAGLLLTPRSVEIMERMAWILAALLGLVAFALPVPEKRRVFYRLGTWLALSGLLWLADLPGLSRFTWERRLASGTVFEKGQSLESLARIGRGDARGAQLDEGEFRGLDLANVDFSGASLKNANFENAFLVEARFDQADISGARFGGANLFGAHLENAVGLQTVECDRFTKLPLAFICEKGTVVPGPVLQGE